MKVEIREVHFQYKAPLFAGFSCAFAAGRVTGIVGENGCGKSTLLKLIAGIEFPMQGVIHWGSQAMSTVSAEQRSRLLGYVGQSMRSAWAMPVRDVLAIGLQERGVQACQEAMVATDCLHLADRKVTELSAGEIQRVMLARAFLHQPPLLLLDEPTTGLDPRHQQLILHQLQQRARDGATILVVLHDLNAAHAVCDEVLILSRSSSQNVQRVAHGKVSAVLTPERVQTVFGV